MRKSPKEWERVAVAGDKKDDGEAVPEPISDDEILEVMCRTFQVTPGPIPSRLRDVLDAVERLMRLRVLGEVLVQVLAQGKSTSRNRLPDAATVVRHMIQNAGG